MEHMPSRLRCDRYLAWYGDDLTHFRRTRGGHSTCSTDKQIKPFDVFLFPTNPPEHNMRTLEHNCKMLFSIELEQRWVRYQRAVFILRDVRIQHNRAVALPSPVRIHRQLLLSRTNAFWHSTLQVRDLRCAY